MERPAEQKPEDSNESGVYDAIQKTHATLCDSLLKIFDPLWKARIDTAKTLLTLSSSILVLTVTFANALGLSQTTHFSIAVYAVLKYSLFGGWTFLSAAILCGAYSLWKSVSLYSFPPALLNQQGEWLALAQKWSQSGQLDEDIYQKTVIEAFQATEQSDKLSQRALTLCFITFAAGILCIVVAGLYKQILQ